jgi:hypothetical protein
MIIQERRNNPVSFFTGFKIFNIVPWDLNRLIIKFIISLIKALFLRLGSFPLSRKGNLLQECVYGLL